MTESYGEGSELDAFDDLPVSPMAEAEFFKRPKVKLRLKGPYQYDGTELDGFKDLPVSTTAEARFLKPPIVAKTLRFGNSTVRIHRRTETFQQLSNITSYTQDPPESHPGLLPLPRELRDQVYRHLLCNTYIVNFPPTIETAIRIGNYASDDFKSAFTLPVHPHFQPPQPRTSTKRYCVDDGSTVAPWNPGTPSYETLRRFEQEGKAREDSARLQRLFKFPVNSQCLPILLASKATSEEAATVLYSTSTFYFSIYRPQRFDLDPRTVDRMKSIYIDVDLVKAYLRDYSTIDQACTLEFCRRVIEKFGGDNVERNLCIISFDRGEETDFLRLPAFMHALKGLIGFKTVVIRLSPAYKGWLKPDHSLKWARHMRKWDVANLTILHAHLRPKLGPSKAFRRKDFCCLIYHPHSHLTGSQPPDYDVENLAEPPEPTQRTSTSARYLMQCP